MKSMPGKSTQVQSDRRGNNCGMIRFVAPFASFFIFSSVAHAAEMRLEEIVVTASKRGEQSMQDIPAAIGALSGSDLSSMGAQGLADFGAKIPGLAIFDAGANRKKIKIRGVSSSTESEPQETVGVYIDDVTITNAGGTNNENGASPDLNLFDLQRIEVLKGPQGTLYGAGSMGGTVRYITNLPDAGKWEGKVRGRGSLTKGGSASYSGDGMINMPIIKDKVALRVVAGAHHNGGYIDNKAPLVGLGFGPDGKVPGKDNFNDDNSWSVRANLMAYLGEALRVQLKYMRREYRVHGTAGVLYGNELDTIDYVEPFNRDNVDIYNAVVDYDLDGATITSSTSYYKRYNLDRQDTTLFSQSVFGPVDPSSQLLNQNKYNDFNQELRIASKSDGALQYVLGAYYSKLNKNFIQDGFWPEYNDYFGATVIGEFPAILVPGTYPNVYQANVDQDVEQFALFGELTFDITDQFELVLGGRYFDVKQNFDLAINPASIFASPGATNRVGSSKENGFNPKITLSYKPDSETTVYATASKGYRIGGFNQPIPNTPQCGPELAALGLTNSPVAYDSDSLWSYEVGAKKSLADQRVQINGAAYKIDWSNIQLRKQLNCGFTFFDNVASASIYGIEGDITALITENLQVTAGIGYVDAQLGESVALFGQEGDQLAGVPKVTASLSAEYRFPLTGTIEGLVRGDLNYIGRFNSLVDVSDPANRESGKYALANIRIGAEEMAGDWSASLFVNNVFNKIAVTGSYNSTFGDYVYRNRPREIGIVASKRF